MAPVVHEDFTSGYWGPPTSLVDFCEPNYAVTYWIAEFYNTLSSIPFALWGILGMLLTHKYATKEFRFKICWISMFIIGCGSTLFHASLLFKYQLLDELPMLLYTTAGLYCVLTLELPPGQTNWKVAICLILMTTTEIVLYIYFEIWTIFFVGFGLNVVIGTVMMLKYYRHLIGRYLWYAVFSYYVASCCWFVDMGYCQYVQKLHLHSMWHLGAGYGSYLGLLTIIIARANFLKKQTKVFLYTLSDLTCRRQLRQENEHSIYIDIPLAHYCVFTEGRTKH